MTTAQLWQARIVKDPITWAQLDDLRAGTISWEELNAAMGGRQLI